MGKAGRPRKSGKRTKSGRLITDTRFDHGSEAAQARRSVFGDDGCDAIGRAFVAGLLGQGQTAKDRKSMARLIYAQYWPTINVPGYRCGLNQETGGFAPTPTVEQHREDYEREQRLTKRLEAARQCGHDTYRAFSQLVIDQHFDSGPDWLDLLVFEWLWRRSTGLTVQTPSMAYLHAQKMLGLAIRGIDAAGRLSESRLTIEA